MGLTSKDIMVGDYVCGILGNMRVVGIGKIIVTGQWADKDNPDVVHETNCIYDVVCPIPISEKILQLNGIEEIYSSPLSKVWRLDLGENDITLRYLIHEGKWFLSAKSMTESIEIRKYVQYIHEVQHILRLFGYHLGEILKFE